MVDYRYYLLVGAILFVLGLVGFITRRNLIVMFLCTELMLTGVIVTLVGYNRLWIMRGEVALEGQAFSIFLMVVAAAEAAVAMALVLIMHRDRKTVNAGEFTSLNG